MKVNITFYFENSHLCLKNLTFENITSLYDAKCWFNTRDKFIDIGNTIINLNNVIYIKIEECKK